LSEIKYFLANLKLKTTTMMELHVNHHYDGVTCKPPLWWS